MMRALTFLAFIGLFGTPTQAGVIEEWRPNPTDEAVLDEAGQDEQGKVSGVIEEWLPRAEGGEPCSSVNPAPAEAMSGWVSVGWQVPAEATGDRCDGSDTAGTCDGTDLVWCGDGEVVRQSCGDIGAVCGIADAGIADCWIEAPDSLSAEGAGCATNPGGAWFWALLSALGFVGRTIVRLVRGGVSP